MLSRYPLVQGRNLGDSGKKSANGFAFNQHMHTTSNLAYIEQRESKASKNVM